MSKKIILISLFIFLAMIIISAPARVVVKLIPESAAVTAAGVSGTVWSGDATTVTVNGQSFTNVRWDIAAWALLLGRAQGEIEVKDSRFNLISNVQLSLDNTLRLYEAMITADAKQLSDYMPMNNIALDGRIRIDLDSAAFHPETGPADVAGEVQWLRGKASITGPLVDLGSFRAAISTPEQSKLLLTMAKSNNVLDLQGTVELQWPTSVELNLSTTDQVPERLKNVIIFLKKDEQGRRNLQMNLPLNFR